MSAALRYSILDPSGNITALVENPCPVGEQPSVAEQIMAARPEVEQVGFVRFCSDEDGVDAELRMAGGEFCGNASMCAAALYLIRSGAAARGGVVRLRVSGAEDPVEVRLSPCAADGGFDAAVRMPRVIGADPVELSYAGIAAVLPVVRFQGIAHAIIEEDSPFFSLLKRRADAEAAVRVWCEELRADSLGLMFLQRFQQGGEPVLTPLVYVPGSGTMFWEGSCASGSSATAYHLSAVRGAPVDLVFREPAGTLRVSSDAAMGEIVLFGHVDLLS